LLTGRRRATKAAIAQDPEAIDGFLSDRVHQGQDRQADDDDGKDDRD
jgi:hypothetical protein